MKVIAALVLVVLIFPGCQKILEYYKPGHHPATLACRIKSYSYDYFGSHYSTTFKYNAKGNPILITYFDVYLPDGKVTESFKYDSLDRLVLHEPDPGMGNTRVYVYEGNYRTPVRDTVKGSQGDVYLESFERDVNGRITREKIELLKASEDNGDWGFKTEVYRYYYDARGNRQANPFDHPWQKTIQYSNDPSLYSLHPTWQLIHRDYSRNSVPNIKKYSPAGLPEEYVFSEFAYWQPFLDLNLNSRIVYDCK